MASSLIGSLRVALGLDTAQFEAGATKSKSIARGLSRDIESSFKSAKVAVEGLVAAFAIGALTQQIKQALQYAAAIGETASTLGVTTKQLQEYRFAAQQSGVAQEQLEGGLTRLAVSMGKAEVGSQAQIKAFNAIGISVDQLKGKNTGDVFGKIADGLKNVTDRSQRAAIEVALFGKAGAQLDSLLSGGTARLNALGQAAQQLGVVLSDEQIQNAEVTAHKLEALKTVLEANIASTVTENANSILSLAQALSTLTTQILHFFSSNPQLALAIIGGLAGSRFGVAGAALGAAGGALLGEKVGQNAADQNTDLHFRIQQLQKARDEVNARRAAEADTGGLISFRHGSGKGGTVDSALAEFKKQKTLLDQATAAALAPKATPQGVNLPKFLGASPSGGSAKKPPADRSDEVLAQMDKEIIQSTQSILQAKQQLAGSNEQHLQISLQLIDIEQSIKDSAIDEEVAKAKRELAEHKITDAAYQQVLHKAAILKGEAAQEAAVKKTALVEEQLAKAEQANFEAADQQKKFALDALRVADNLATTQADHRRIQLQILDSEIAQRRYELEHEKQLAIRNGATAEQIKVIQDQIDHLGTERAQGAAQINRNTQNPLEAWAQQVPKTAAEINEALQSIEVKGLDGLSEAITGVITGTESLKDAFHQLAISVLQDLIQMTIKMLIFRAIAAIGGAVAGGASGGADFSGAGAGLDFGTDFSTIPVSGFANGGSFMVGGRSGTDMNLLSINGIPRARVSASEMVNVGAANDRGGFPPPISIITNIDATGADPAELSRVRAAVEQLHAEVPRRAVAAVLDAQTRNLIRT
jgi:lambda family phage tail tape measure protein